MLVDEIMTKNVVTINLDETIFYACNQYKKYRVGCLVVMENDAPVGIVTERDIIEKIICQDMNPKNSIVKEVMSSNLITIDVTARVEEAAEIMKIHKIKKLPVVRNNKIVGIVTVTDIANVLPDFSKEVVTENHPFRFV